MRTNTSHGEQAVASILDRTITKGLGGIFTNDPLENGRLLRQVTSNGSAEMYLEVAREIESTDQLEENINRLLASGNVTMRSLMEKPDETLRGSIASIPTRNRESRVVDIFNTLTDEGVRDYLSQHPEERGALYQEALKILPPAEIEWGQAMTRSDVPHSYEDWLIGTYLAISMPLQQFLIALDAKYTDEL